MKGLRKGALFFYICSLNIHLNIIMKIIFENGTLRPWEAEDAKELAVIANNKKVADNLRDGFPNPYGISDAHKWLDMVLPINDPPKYFAIIHNKRLAGSIAIVTKEDIYRKNVEIGYFLAEEHWGQGIITNAIKAITSYAFSEFDIVRVYAEPFADNPGSRRALEKAGFKCEAIFRKNVVKNGVIKDSCIYSVLKEDFHIE
jgi:ribosomal-protein-alanine N-acetyltransferase